jgi:ATP-binding cassette, subfamily C, bacterial LapB
MTDLPLHTDALAAPGEADLLAEAVVAFIALRDQPISIAALAAGLPLIDGRFTPGLMVSALNRYGYEARLMQRSLRNVPEFLYPAIIILEHGDAVILLKKSARHYLIFDPMTNTKVETTHAEIEQAYSGQVIVAKPITDRSVVDDGTSNMYRGHWFWSAIRMLWRSYFLVVFAAVMINLIAIASPLFTMNVYDRVLPNKAIPTLWVLALGMAIALVFDYIIKSLRSWLIDSAGRRADVLLASRIYAHVLSIQMAGKPTSTGSFASYLKEFDQVREFFTSSTIATFTDMLFFFVFLFVIYLVGGPIVYVAIVAAVAMIIAGLVFQIPLRRAAEKNAVEAAQRHSLLIETIGSLETLKAVRAEGFLQRKWEGLVGTTSRTVERVRQLNASLANLTSAVQQLSTVAMVVVGAYLFQDGQMTTGAIIAAVMLASRAIAPLGNFAMVLARSQQSITSLRHLEKIMEMPSERPEGKNFITQPITDCTIEFQNVVFSYGPQGVAVLNGFNLRIKPGEKVGIIGKIGSGKTTLGRLLTKLYEPQSGAVLMNGIDMRQYHPHEVRRVVGLLGQDAELFQGTVRSNILMGKQNASDAEMLRAAKLAGVEDFVGRHPAGFDMQVGERGQALSGGQRQAVALARVLIADPQIIFLDEPSSAMDMASERVLIEQLRKALRPDQTIIVSTHRHSMLEIVDRLVVVAGNKVAADGPKAQVMDALRKQAGAAV